MFTTRPVTSPHAIEFKGIRIPWMHQIKYLEIILDKRLTWQVHTTHAEINDKAVVNLLRPLLGRRSKLDRRNKRLLFQAMAAHTVLYGAATWSHAHKTNCKKIQVQNKALTTIVDAPWYVRNTNTRRDLEISTIKEVLRKRTTGVYSLAEIHTNELVGKVKDNRTRKRGHHAIEDLKPHWYHPHDTRWSGQVDRSTSARKIRYRKSQVNWVAWIMHVSDVDNLSSRWKFRPSTTKNTSFSVFGGKHRAAEKCHRHDGPHKIEYRG